MKTFSSKIAEFKTHVKTVIDVKAPISKFKRDLRVESQVIRSVSKAKSSHHLLYDRIVTQLNENQVVL